MAAVMVLKTVSRLLVSIMLACGICMDICLGGLRRCLHGYFGEEDAEVARADVKPIWLTSDIQGQILALAFR